MKALPTRAVFGVTLLAFAFSHNVKADQPAIKTVPPHPRIYPSDEELETFLKPLPPTSIPDDPPPHEGAMFEIRYLIAPPDLLLVEVLEALPGRPISGERLVRPDGTISLGFYGDVHVKGLTAEQAKAKIILHLRGYVNDDYLGLLKIEVSEHGDREPPVRSAPASIDDHTPLPAPVTDLEAEEPKLGTPDEKAPPDQRAKRSNSRKRQRGPRTDEARRPKPLTAPRDEIEKVKSGESTVKARETGPKGTELVDAQPLEPETWVSVHPADSDRVFVDITAFNTQVYYVLGDVTAPGRMPITGTETVLDALNFAGGFLATANPKDIRLIRPARAGRPVRIYQVDYEAITEKGDSTANYQLFPGDRLVVGRNDVVKKTIQIDRLTAPLHTIFHFITQYNMMIASLKHLGDPTAATVTLTEAERQAVIKVWSDFWTEAMAEKEGVSFDARRLQESLLRALEPATKEGAESSKSK